MACSRVAFALSCIWDILWAKLSVASTAELQVGSEPIRCRWENKIFWGGTTLHNSQGAEYVDGKGTGLMNLGGDCHDRFPRIRKWTQDKSDLAQPPGQALSHWVSDSDG